MLKVSIHEAKTNLSRLIAAAEAGEEVVITRRNEPVVTLVPASHTRKVRVPGRLAGKVKLTPEFFEPLPDEELRLWGEI